MTFSTIVIKDIINENRELGLSPVIYTCDGQTFSEERDFCWKTGFPSIQEKDYYREKQLHFEYYHAKGLIKIKTVSWHKDKGEQIIGVAYIPEQNITAVSFRKVKEYQTRGVEY